MTTQQQQFTCELALSATGSTLNTAVAGRECVKQDGRIVSLLLLRASRLCVCRMRACWAGTHLAAAATPNVRHRCHIRLRTKPNSLRAIVRFGAHPFVEIRKRCAARTLHLGGNLCLVPVSKQQQPPEVSEQRSASRGEWPERRQASQEGSRQCVPARQ